ncbi:toluene hydroxylase [Alicyclobacillus shizuokensis]|uniref:toluene hydroxylase n=1 Tax=Alicyclobacillus shizuokensis TaxID=392014 RepID=UPI000833F198|nr:toluene hydroxylase [Alicyclobacillus shizuokensis]MCL6625363.1 toluene hydroxylase [Alicyclobacillus shizuokensis]
MQARNLQPIRQQPWDWATKNEYEEVTLREQPYIHGHYRNKYYKPDYDIYDPRYTRVRVRDWEAFRDPKKLWYQTYVMTRKKMADEVEALFERAGKLAIYERVDPAWRKFSLAFYTPLRHYEYAGAVQLQHVVRYAMGCPIEQAATYTAFDKQGRAQWLSTWALEFAGGEGLQALQHARQLWLEDESYDKLRSYMEHVLVTDDWVEVLVALHLAIEPILDRLAYEQLNAISIEHGDPVLAELALICSEQVQWQENWTASLFQLIATDPTTSRWDYLKSLGYEDWPGDYRWGRTLSNPKSTPEETLTNQEIMSQWASKWISRAIQAVTPLQSLLDRHGISCAVEPVMERAMASYILPTLEKCGIDVKISV